MVSTLGNAIQFLQEFGLFDVILPFLLVFTLVFAILEKTKIFGVEGKEQLPRKNLNAMVAFAIAFFVVSAVNIVGAFQVALPWVALVLVVLVCFLLLSGVFFEESKDKTIFSLFSQHKALTTWMVVILLLVVLYIFLYAFNLHTYIFGLFSDGGQSGTILTSVILLLLLGASMWYVAGGGNKKEGSSGK